VSAAGVATSAAWGEVGAASGFVGAVGAVVVLVAVTTASDDALIIGAILLFASYAISVADDGGGVDRAAPLVGAALLAVVEFGSWSLELGDGAEERPEARASRLALLVTAAAAASGVVLALGSMRVGGGLLLWIAAALAGIGLLALVGRPAR
jgi:hypothetical protein